MAFYGPAGLLSGSDDVRLTGDGVMRVRRMAVDEMAGPLDLKVGRWTLVGGQLWPRQSGRRDRSVGCGG